eukprot:29024-Pelagococcus_subviridis.AAC.11
MRRHLVHLREDRGKETRAVPRGDAAERERRRGLEILPAGVQRGEEHPLERVLFRRRVRRRRRASELAEAQQREQPLGRVRIRLRRLPALSSLKRSALLQARDELRRGPPRRVGARGGARRGDALGDGFPNLRDAAARRRPRRAHRRAGAPAAAVRE